MGRRDVGEVVPGAGRIIVDQVMDCECGSKAEPAAGFYGGRENSLQTQHNGDPDAPGKVRLATILFPAAPFPLNQA